MRVKGWPQEFEVYSDDYTFFAGNVLGYARRPTPMEAMDACRDHTDREVQVLIAIPASVKEFSISMFMPQVEGMILIFSTLHSPEQRGNPFSMRPKKEDEM